MNEAKPYTPHMEFGSALDAIKAGATVSRAGWNGKGMFLFLVMGRRNPVTEQPLVTIMGVGTNMDFSAYIGMKTAQGEVVPWTASQADLMASDWQINRNLDMGAQA